MTTQERDPAGTGRLLARALIVLGGAAAAIAAAWLTATASAGENVDPDVPASPLDQFVAAPDVNGSSPRSTEPSPTGSGPPPRRRSPRTANV